MLIRYSIDDPEFVSLMDADKLQKELGPQAGLVFFFPFLKIFKGDILKRQLGTFLTLKDILKVKYPQHVATYEEGKVRDFCDALIAAKREAEEEDKDTKQYFKDENMVMTLYGFFFGK